MTAEFEMKKDESVIIVNATKKRTTSDGCADNRGGYGGCGVNVGQYKIITNVELKTKKIKVSIGGVEQK